MKAKNKNEMKNAISLRIHISISSGIHMYALTHIHFNQKKNVQNYSIVFVHTFTIRWAVSIHLIRIHSYSCCFRVVSGLFFLFYFEKKKWKSFIVVAFKMCLVFFIQMLLHFPFISSYKLDFFQFSCHFFHSVLRSHMTNFLPHNYCPSCFAYTHTHPPFSFFLSLFRLLGFYSLSIFSRQDQDFQSLLFFTFEFYIPPFQLCVSRCVCSVQMCVCVCVISSTIAIIFCKRTERTNWEKRTRRVNKMWNKNNSNLLIALFIILYEAILGKDGTSLCSVYAPNLMPRL